MTFSNIFKVFKKKYKDALVFQISEDFIEVAVVRRKDIDVAEDIDPEGFCAVRVLYQYKAPRATVAKGDAPTKVFDDLAMKLGTIADDAVMSPELQETDFNIGKAQIICIFVKPLSRKAVVMRTVTLKRPTKITLKLLQKVFTRGEVTLDELSDIPEEYALYTKTIAAVALNGYHTQKPINKTAQNISVSVSSYLAAADFWNATGTVLERTFHRELRYVHTDMPFLFTGSKICNEIYTGGELQAIADAIL